MKIIRFIKQTTFVVTKGENTILSVPTVVLVLLMLFFWQLIIPAMIIGLFLGAGFFFEGSTDEDRADRW